MIIVDEALKRREAEGNPVRVGLIGAGTMGGAIARQIVSHVPGMQLAAICNRTVQRAGDALPDVDGSKLAAVNRGSEVQAAIRDGKFAVTSDHRLLCEAENVDVVFEATGAVEFGAHALSCAIDAGKHVVTMNAELDATVGPLLAARATQAGVVFSGSDGDQPAVQMNLVRFARSIGLKPVLCGNIKGLHDPYRTPETQRGFARKWGQNVNMVTSFADGTKISFEQAVVANATGMTIAARGMTGRSIEGSVTQLAQHYHAGELEALGGIVDYVVGAEPAPGVFVLASMEDPNQRMLLELYKLGKGPLYCLYTPYHLCHFEAPLSAARAAIFGDAAIRPQGGPVVEVVAAAKCDLAAGTVIDGIGGFHTYGICETADITRCERLLPMGVAEGCVLKTNIPRDAVLNYADVQLPQNRLIDRLRREQEEMFSPTKTDGAL